MRESNFKKEYLKHFKKCMLPSQLSIEHQWLLCILILKFITKIKVIDSLVYFHKSDTHDLPNSQIEANYDILMKK